MIREIVKIAIATPLVLGPLVLGGVAQAEETANNCIVQSAPTHSSIDLPGYPPMFRTSVTFRNVCLSSNHFDVEYTWSNDGIKRSVCLDQSPGTATVSMQAISRYPILTVVKTVEGAGQC